MGVAEPPVSRRGGWWRTLVFTLTAAGLTYAAGLVMFSAFMYYDDEGYVMISLRNFAEHGGLYREVYSQYGPFPFVAYYLMHGLGLPFTHVAGRLITLAAWVGAALCCATMVRQATRSFAASLIVLAGVFPYLWIMVSEPSHPGGLIAGITALAAALGFHWLGQGRTQAWAVLAGAVAAALALTKINVGGFVVIAGLSWILVHHQSAGIRRWSRPALMIGAVLLPLALMRPMLDSGWVQTFALVFACSGIAVIVATTRHASPIAGWGTLGACVAGGTVTAAAILGVLLARGTGPLDAIEGIFLAPLKQPAAFNLGYPWATGTPALAAASLAACLGAGGLHRRHAAIVDPIIAFLRLLAAAGAIYAVLTFPDASPDRLVFGYGAPCLWLFLWPLARNDHPSHPALNWVAFLWLGQFLHAFPVAGSQIAWGTYLALPIAAIGAWDALRWLSVRFAWNHAAWRARAVPILGTALVALALVIGVRFARVGERYRDGRDLALPGAELLRLPTETTALFRLLTLNATTHGDVLFSEPGMFSLNLWSGLPTPNLSNVTHWFSLLPAARQQGIVAQLEAHPRACVVIQRAHINYLIERKFTPGGVLHDYIARTFTPVFTLDGFEFCVRRGRTFEPLQLGELVVRSEEPATENTVLKIRLLLPPGIGIERIELTAPQAPGAAKLSFHAGNARVEVIPPARPGAPPGPGKFVAWPFQLDGATTVLVHFNRFSHPRPTAGGVITFFGPGGAEIGLGRLKQ